MYRKARQTAEREFKRYGADRWSWDGGRGKHEIVSVFFGPTEVRMGFAHGAVDETLVKHIIQNRFRQAGIHKP